MKIKFVVTLLAGTAIAIMSASCTAGAKIGSVVGGVTGAGAGTIVGAQKGRPLEGAAIGGAVGAGAGALVGGALDQRKKEYHPSMKKDRFPH